MRFKGPLWRMAPWSGLGVSISIPKHFTNTPFLWLAKLTMPRRPRIHLPGVPIHLVQRGHNREACFFTDEDFLAYLEWLGDALKKTGCALHAYVLMTNHVHLLLTPPSAEAVSQLVMSLGRRYVQYINKTYRRTGTLWDSRYKSSLVHAEDYLLLCQRYTGISSGLNLSRGCLTRSARRAMATLPWAALALPRRSQRWRRELAMKVLPT